MANPVYLSLTLAAASANNISLSQTPGGAGNLTITGAAATAGIATLDVPRRVLISTAGNDVARSFTVYGSGLGGYPISEIVTAIPNTTSKATLQDFLKVTRVSVDAATAGAITVGTNGAGSTKWVPIDHFRASFAIGLMGHLVSGAVTFQPEFTLDPYDPRVFEDQPANGPGSFVAPTAFISPAFASGSADAAGLHLVPCTAVRFAVTAGAGLLRGAVVQSGLTP